MIIIAVLLPGIIAGVGAMIAARSVEAAGSLLDNRCEAAYQVGLMYGRQEILAAIHEAAADREKESGAK